MPNWIFDVVCLRTEVAHDVRSRFRVDLLPVRKPRDGDTGVFQIVTPTTQNPWFDPVELGHRAQIRHGTAGRRCEDCGVWRWFPVPDVEKPPVRVDPMWSGVDVVASPEWFGDGWNAFRDLLFRRDLALTLVHAHPRVWSLVERDLYPTAR
jgi:hypothetical protein